MTKSVAYGACKSEVAVEKKLKKSPLHLYWIYGIDEMFVLDDQRQNLPVVTTK